MSQWILKKLIQWAERKETVFQKKQRIKGPLDILVTLKANPNKGDGKEINKEVEKELSDKTCRKIARFLYDADSPFNGAIYPSFGEMCETNGQYHQELKPPITHQLRGPLKK